MARKLRIQLPGSTYLITSRGDRGQAIFHDDADRALFLNALGEAGAKTGWHVLAYCMLPDHFHLVVETPEPNLVSGMKWFLGTFTARFNRRHKIRGHVFAGRYKSLLIGPHGPYLAHACDYVHLNPARARLLTQNETLRQFPWSSLPAFLNSASRPPWLRVGRRLHGDPFDDSPDGRDSYARHLAELQDNPPDAEFRNIRRGWCYGDEAFRNSMLLEVGRSAHASHFGSELQEASEAKAARIIDEELRTVLWTEAELLRRRKGDPVKVAIATRLRAETTVTLQWIASRLKMGTKTHLSHLLYWDRRENGTTADRASDTPRSAGARISRNPRRITAVNAATQGPAVPPSEPKPAEPSPQRLPALDKVLPLPDPFVFDTSFD